MQKIDPHTQKPVIGKDGKPVTEEKEVTIPAYKVVSVFAVSQTEGKELPDIAVDELTTGETIQTPRGTFHVLSLIHIFPTQNGAALISVLPDMLTSPQPVSYTHLDVYKRQALHRRTTAP